MTVFGMPLVLIVTEVPGGTMEGRSSNRTIVSLAGEKSSRRKMWRSWVHGPVASPALGVQFVSKRAP
jgi:hypothetical protein